jgi:chromosome segregation ATPase
MTNNNPGESGGGALSDGGVPSESGAPSDSGVVFDANSGISREEQREILDGINRIAEKNRRSLSGTARSFKASKKGGLFPIAVNAAVALILAGGFFAMSSLHDREEIRLREGTKVFNSAERALISEIRKETSLQIEAKENEMFQIISKMEDVDARLRELYSNNMELSSDQLAAEGNLKRLQDEYRLNLAGLRDDRSRILENARVREAGLYAQLEERSREISALSERSEAALSSARGELERLRTEEEKAAAIEAQLGAFFQLSGDQIRSGLFAEAGDTLKIMRVFLNTPAFQGFRSVQARKELYTQSITALETMLEEARRNQEALTAAGKTPAEDSYGALEELLAKNAQLEQTIAGLNQSLQSAGSHGSGLTRRLTELERSAAALQTSLSAREQTIASLESNNTNLSQTLSTQDNTIRELRTQNAAQEERISSLDTQLTSLRQALQALSQ